MKNNKTLVIQSHSNPLPYSWLRSCLHSVEHWAQSNHYEYRFIGDELFDLIPPDLIEKTVTQKVIATDLARLRLIQQSLTKYETVIWCDADFLIFDPEQFTLRPEDYALGREVWIQNQGNSLKQFIKVHNAFLMFRQGNSFLDFYAESAQSLLRKNKGTMPPQFIGPKLLTALHNIVQCPVQESAGMLSPLVIHDIAHQAGPALELFLGYSQQPVYAANLCASLCQPGSETEKEIEICIEVLLNKLITLDKETLT